MRKILEFPIENISKLVISLKTFPFKLKKGNYKIMTWLNAINKA